MEKLNMDRKSGWEKRDGDFVEVWEDVVSIKDLLFSLAVTSVVTLGAYFIAPDEPPKPLFFGLGGAITGFTISSVFIKPKRKLHD